MSIQKSKRLTVERVAYTSVALFGMLCSVERAVARTCYYEPATLAENYANAVGIVVAEVQGCANGAELTNGRCPCAYGATSASGLCPLGYRYRLNVLEVLKNSVPPQDFSGTYVGSDGFMSCGTVFIPGESYLLFVSGPESIDHARVGC